MLTIISFSIISLVTLKKPLLYTDLYTKIAKRINVLTLKVVNLLSFDVIRRKINQRFRKWIILENKRTDFDGSQHVLTLPSRITDPLPHLYFFRKHFRPPFPALIRQELRVRRSSFFNKKKFFYYSETFLLFFFKVDQNKQNCNPHGLFQPPRYSARIRENTDQKKLRIWTRSG